MSLSEGLPGPARTAVTNPIVGAAPSTLVKHALSDTFNIVGMTPDEFTKTFAGQAFDYLQVQKDFKTHCYDYNEGLTMDVKSLAVEFCAKMIYTAGPESRKIKPGQVDKTWRFIFKDRRGQDHYVFVSTYKTQTYDYKNDETVMSISVKQASLVAMDTLNRITILANTENQTILTPLAGAIFSRDDMKEIAIVLQRNVDEATIIINSSCQSGGQYLTLSDGSTAVVAAFAATRNLKDENLRRSIITKITKQYDWQKFQALLLQRFDGATIRSKLYSQLYAVKQGEKENTGVFLQKKIQLFQRLHQGASGDEIVPTLLELLRPTIRQAIRASQPKDFDTLITRALEAESDESDILRSAPKKEEKRAPNEPAQNQRTTRKCWHCPGWHLHADCPVLKERNSGRTQNQENWRVATGNLEPVAENRRQN